MGLLRRGNDSRRRWMCLWTLLEIVSRRPFIWQTRMAFGSLWFTTLGCQIQMVSALSHHPRRHRPILSPDFGMNSSSFIRALPAPGRYLCMSSRCISSRYLRDIFADWSAHLKFAFIHGRATIDTLPTYSKEQRCSRRADAGV